MKTSKYGYTAQTKPGRVNYTYRPLVNVEVGGAIEKRTFKALTDSGSDITVMDKAIAEILGISSEGCKTGTLSTLGKPTEGFLAPISLKFEGFTEIFNFTVLFIENLSENFEIILGQQDFFTNFNVTFKKSQNLFYLEIEN